ncbi:MAG: hypothetical protein GY849_20625 [Deltaproteobacteria bacterium]|nr:hypothetical protein [Deltaproteobacteria bacterium]
MESRDNTYPDLSSENKDLRSEGSDAEDEDALAEMAYENEHLDEDEGPEPEDDMEDKAGHEDFPSGKGSRNQNGAHQAPVSADVAQAVEDAQLLVAYVAREGVIDIDEGIVRTLIQSKYLLERHQWDAEAELRFWKAHDDMSVLIKPVTLDSLKWTMPPFVGAAPAHAKKKRTRADYAVRKYGLIAIFSLMLLLICQVYSIVGTDLTQSLGDLLEKTEQAEIDYKRLKTMATIGKSTQPEANSELMAAREKYNDLNQEFGASYDVLTGWNTIWRIAMVKGPLSVHAPPYVQELYDEDMKALERRIKDLEEKLRAQGAATADRDDISKRMERVREDRAQRTYQYGFDNDRRRFFLNKNSAEFVLRALNIYLLPLLYGLLGAVTFVLRSLSIEIKQLTFTYDSDIRYRLRLSLGALAGMAVGWFLKPEELESLGSISPMALAFLMGYNVEVLFSIMDRFIAMASQWVPGGKNPNEGGAGTNQKPAA